MKTKEKYNPLGGGLKFKNGVVNKGNKIVAFDSDKICAKSKKAGLKIFENENHMYITMYIDPLCTGTMYIDPPSSIVSQPLNQR